jgi:hypothetical protein
MASATIDLSTPIGDGSPEAATAELARMMAAAPKPPGDGIEVITGDQLSSRVYEAVNEYHRLLGFTEAAIEQLNNGHPVGEREKRLAQVQLDRLMSNPEFKSRLFGGGKLEEHEFVGLAGLLRPEF